MIEIDESAAGFYVRVGPFQDRAMAEKLEEFLDGMKAEARLNAREPLPSARVMEAVCDAIDGLKKRPGHFVLRGDGGPHKPEDPEIEMSTGRKYRKAG